jgi:hypothetical protein
MLLKVFLWLANAGRQGLWHAATLRCVMDCVEAPMKDAAPFCKSTVDAMLVSLRALAFQ